MKTGQHYIQEILQMKADLKVRIATVHATFKAAPIFFEEPWDIGAVLDDETYFQASGLAQKDQRTVVLDAISGSDYDLEDVPVEDLVWVLIALESNRFSYVETN